MAENSPQRRVGRPRSEYLEAARTLFRDASERSIARFANGQRMLYEAGIFDQYPALAEKCHTARGGFQFAKFERLAALAVLEQHQNDPGTER